MLATEKRILHKLYEANQDNQETDLHDLIQLLKSEGYDEKECIRGIEVLEKSGKISVDGRWVFILGSGKRQVETPNNEQNIHFTKRWSA